MPRKNALQRIMFPAGRFVLLFTRLYPARRLILTPGLSGGIISVNPRAFRQFEDIFRSPYDPAALGTVMVFHRTGEVEHRDSGIQARIVRCGQFIGKSDKQYPVSVHNKAVGLQV